MQRRKLVACYFLLIFCCFVHTEYEEIEKLADNLLEEKLNYLDIQSDFSEIIIGYPRNISDIYSGNWKLNESKHNFDEAIWGFERNMGGIIFNLKSTPTNISENFDFIYGYVEIRDGVHSTDEYLRYHVLGISEWKKGFSYSFGLPVDENFIEIEEELKDNINNNETFVNEVMLTRRFPVNLTNIELECTLLVSIQMEILEQDKLHVMSNRTEPFDPRFRIEADPIINFNFTLESVPCNFFLEGTVSSLLLPEYFRKASNYVNIVAFLTVVQIILISVQIQFSNTPSCASRVSMSCVGMQAVLDSYICLFHLVVGIFIDDTWNMFLIVAFLYFISFSVFEMRYLMIIWKARRPSEPNQDWEDMRRQISSMYTKIYVSLILGFSFIYFLADFLLYFLIFMHSYWVPQIFCNATRNTRNPFDRKYLFGISLIRLFIPLYFLQCPSNYLHIEPKIHFVVALLGWTFIQIVVLILQDRIGPRFFVPKFMLPEQYNYFQRVTFSEEKECVICMNPVQSDGFEHMITPCNHVFHANCLEKWLEIKLACPTCRAKLPPP